MPEPLDPRPRWRQENIERVNTLAVCLDRLRGAHLSDELRREIHSFIPAKPRLVSRADAEWIIWDKNRDRFEKGDKILRDFVDETVEFILDKYVLNRNLDIENEWLYFSPVLLDLVDLEMVHPTLGSPQRVYPRELPVDDVQAAPHRLVVCKLISLGYEVEVFFRHTGKWTKFESVHQDFSGLPEKILIHPVSRANDETLIMPEIFRT